MDETQLSDIGDLDAHETRKLLHRVADWIADYFETGERFEVMPKTGPGDVRRALAPSPPELGEEMDRILDDFDSIIVPNVTHWNHPRFMAYFAISGSAPGVAGEALAAALNLNGMLWRSSPAFTELEELVTDWVAQMMGLPDVYTGHINDTASLSTFLALAAARHRATDGTCRDQGLTGRADLPPMALYASEEAHSSVDKAAVALGFGLDSLRRLETDDALRMRPDVLESAIAADRAAGRRPVAVIATAGTTSTTSVDPIPSIADICSRENLWLHVDAAYAGAAAICPELRSLLPGLDRADSLVVNPHKWLFTPIDCSLLFVRDPALLKETFSVVPEYLRTNDAEVTNLMDYGIQLGRRFRALKLWMVIRSFGVDGLRKRILHHCALARDLEQSIAASHDFEVLAPVPFSLVCFRALTHGHDDDAFNEALLARINGTGRAFLSHTRIKGRFALRLAIGNIRTTRAHVDDVWKTIVDEASALRAETV